MTKYDVTISRNRKKVSVSTPQKYGIDVNFEVPTKAIQYSNIILDDITSGFNGIGRTFSLYDDGTAYSPINDQQLLVGKNNYFLEPSEDFVVSGSSIVFTDPPLPSDDIFVIALVTTADLTRTVNFIIDSGNQVMTPGEKGMLTVDVNGIIESWKILSETSGNLQVDIQKSTYSTYPTFTSILSGNYPTITQDNKAFDNTLTGWDTTILSGDILKFVVNYSVDIKQFLISLKLKL